MDPRQRILLDKLARPEDIPNDGRLNAAELRREAGINAALSGLRIKAGPEPGRQRMLAGALAQTHTDRENNMNPIIRLLGGRPWPARLAILATLLLAVTMMAQLPASTSYAQSAGRAIVFDLGVAASDSEVQQKQQDWQAQSRRILDEFRAIRGSVHRVAMMSDPLADNLHSLSGVIFVLDEAADDSDNAAARRARDRFAAYGDAAGIKVHMQELQDEITMLSGGADERSREELDRAREELARAKVLLVEVMGERDGKLQEASGLLETRLRLIEEIAPDAGQLADMQLRLQKVLEERELAAAAGSDHTELSVEIQHIVAEEQRRMHEELGPVLDEQRRMLEELDIEALVEEQLALHADELDNEQILQELERELAGLDLDLVAIDLDGELQGLEVELREALAGLEDMDEIREIAIRELRNEETGLRELNSELLNVEMHKLEDGLLEMKVELQQLEDGQAVELREMEKEMQAELRVELDGLQQELEAELSSLEGLELGELMLELQQLEDLKDVILELRLPEGELLELTMLEELHRAGEGEGKISFRFEDHLFSFPANTPAKKMAATVNKWLKENGFDCSVMVELQYDDNDELCGARAVVRE